MEASLPQALCRRHSLRLYSGLSWILQNFEVVLNTCVSRCGQHECIRGWSGQGEPSSSSQSPTTTSLTLCIVFNSGSHIAWTIANCNLADLLKDDLQDSENMRDELGLLQFASSTSSVRIAPHQCKVSSFGKTKLISYYCCLVNEIARVF